MTLDFGQGDALSGSLRPFSAKCSFASQANWCMCAEVGSPEKSFHA